MEIKNIAMEKIKISPNSITVKNDTGKTAGVVRGTCQFKNLQPNKQVDYWKILRTCGVLGSGLVDNVVFYDGKMYYLHDLRPLENYEKYFGKNPSEWKNETKRYQERKAIAENMSKYCAVIPCYIIY